MPLPAARLQGTPRSRSASDSWTAVDASITTTAAPRRRAAFGRPRPRATGYGLRAVGVGSSAGLLLKSERVPLFTAGVNRVRLVARPQDLVRSGSHTIVAQSPKPIRKHWGPSRRHALPGAHTTPAPATRDEVTARHNPTPPACEPAHRGLKGRQTDGTARVCPRSNRGRSPGAVSGAVQGDSASVRKCNPPHPLRGSRTEREPEYAHEAESCLRRCRDRPDPEREEIPAFTPGRMS